MGFRVLEFLWRKKFFKRMAPSDISGQARYSPDPPFGGQYHLRWWAYPPFGGSEWEEGFKERILGYEISGTRNIFVFCFEEYKKKPLNLIRGF